MSISMAAWCGEVRGGNKVSTQVVSWKLKECWNCIIGDKE